MIRVVIVDDHAVVREGLRAVLRTSDVEVVGEASDGASAVSICASLMPQVVLMDLQLPDIDGIEATRIIKATCPGARVSGGVKWSMMTAEPMVMKANRPTS